MIAVLTTTTTTNATTNDTAADRSDRHTSGDRPDRPGDGPIDAVVTPATSWRPRSTAQVRVCCAAIAAYIAVDAFVDLRPGTSAGDHLVSGTVPVLVLAAAAISVRRVRPGAAALVSLMIGIASVIAGIGAPASGLRNGHIGAASITGSVALIAGAMLVGLGVETLVRSRRRDGRPLRRWTRRTARGVCGMYVLLVVAAPAGAGFVIANRSDPTPLAIDLGPRQQSVMLTTSDGIALDAAYLPSQNGAAVIVFPGTGAGRAEMLVRHGYGVLLLDPRGQGDSEGDPHLLGWTGERDLRAAVDFLGTQPDVDAGRIGGLGLSVGGELLLQAAAHDERLRAVVSEGAGTRSVAENLHDVTPASLLDLPFWASATAATAVFSDGLPPPRLEDLVGDIAPRPILLIWTSRGQGGEHLNPLYHSRAGRPAEIWEIPDGTHVDGLAARPDEYEDRVVGFFDDALQTDIDRGSARPSQRSAVSAAMARMRTAGSRTRSASTRRSTSGPVRSSTLVIAIANSDPDGHERATPRSWRITRAARSGSSRCPGRHPASAATRSGRWH
jgi:uncharacterized protein